jgi:hypothetical protein
VGDAPQAALLRDARDLIARSWTGHAEARDRSGTAVDPLDPAAASWSLLGALVAAHDKQAASNEQEAFAALVRACTALAELVDNDSLQAWNDAPERDQADVLSVLDTAARLEVDPPPILTIAQLISPPPAPEG